MIDIFSPQNVRKNFRPGIFEKVSTQEAQENSTQEIRKRVNPRSSENFWPEMFENYPTRHFRKQIFEKNQTSVFEKNSNQDVRKIFDPSSKNFWNAMFEKSLTQNVPKTFDLKCSKKVQHRIFEKFSI